MTLEQITGLGLEQEGFLLDQGQNLVTHIESQPSSAWLLTQIQQQLPGLAKLCSLEQAAGHFELKTLVHQTVKAAVEEIMSLRAKINELLPSGTTLQFVPIPPKDFEFVPATFDETSRAWKFFQTFEGKPDLIKSAVTSSLQLNTSQPFSDPSLNLMDKLEIARIIHNHFARNLDLAAGFNDPTKTNHNGETRLFHGEKFVTAVRAEKFTALGIEPQEAAFPRPFTSLDAMLQRMMLCSDATTFEDIDPKDFHSLYGKPQWDPETGLVVFETRCNDAVDSAFHLEVVCNHMNRMIQRALI